MKCIVTLWGTLYAVSALIEILSVFTAHRILWQHIAKSVLATASTMNIPLTVIISIPHITKLIQDTLKKLHHEN